MFKKKEQTPQQHDYVAEIKERCSAKKIASVAGIAVLGYVIETALKVVTGTTTD